MEKTPSLARLIKRAIDNRLTDVHTAIIGRVESYDHKTQTADIQPVLKISGEEELQLLVDVPLLFPRAGGYFISLPIQKGDYVQVLFNETAIDNFLTKSATTIGNTRRFTLQGAVAIPGIYPQSRTIHDAHKTNFVVGKDEGVQLHIDGEKIRLGSKKADEALALAKSVKDELEKIRTAFNDHTHTGECGTGAVKTNPVLFKISHIGDIATKKVVGE